MSKITATLLLLLLSACTFVERQVECYYESGYEGRKPLGYEEPRKVDTVK